MENGGGEVGEQGTWRIEEEMWGAEGGAGRMAGGEMGSRGRHRWVEVIQGDWLTNHNRCEPGTLLNMA